MVPLMTEVLILFTKVSQKKLGFDLTAQVIYVILRLEQKRKKKVFHLVLEKRWKKANLIRPHKLLDSYMR